MPAHWEPQLVLGAVPSMPFMVGPSHPTELGDMAILSCSLLGIWLGNPEKGGIIWSSLSSITWVRECKGNGLHSTHLSPAPSMWKVSRWVWYSMMRVTWWPCVNVLGPALWLWLVVAVAAGVLALVVIMAMLPTRCYPPEQP